MHMKPMRMALRTSLGYALFAALWILLSDRALVALVSDPQVVGTLSTYKGWAFVAVTGFLLYGTLRTQLQRWQWEVSTRIRTKEALRESEEKYRSLFDDSPVALLELDGSGPKAYVDALGHAGVTDLRAYFDEHPEEERQCASSLRIIDVNRAFIDSCGSKDKELLLLSLEKMFAVDEGFQRTFRHILVAIGEGRTTYECEILKLAGNDKKVYEYTKWSVPAGYEETHSRVLIFVMDITKRKQAEESLRTSQLRLSEAMALARLAYWEADGTTGVFTFNDAFYDLIGTNAEREGGYTMGMEQYFRKFVHPEDLSTVYHFVEGVRADADLNRSYDIEARIIRGDGEVRHILVRLTVSRDPAGQSVKLFGINQDVTDRKKAEEALKESESRFRGSFEASGIGMVIVALDGRWLKVNQSFCDMVGYSEEELLAKTFHDITHPDDLKNDLEYVQRLIDEQIPNYRLEKRYYHRDGYIVWGALSVSLVRDARGYPLYFVGQIEDITENKLFDEKLQTMVITDELTGLHNRKGFFELASEQLRLASERHTLLTVNLDHVKWINDTLGHREGDAALVTVARLLKDTFREPGIVGRLGGVEFAVLAPGVTEADQKVLLARLQHNIERFSRDHVPSFPITLGIGCAHCEPGKRCQLEALLAEADDSMYKKKWWKQAKGGEGLTSPKCTSAQKC